MIKFCRAALVLLCWRVVDILKSWLATMQIVWLVPLPLESGNQIVVGVYGVFFPTNEGILLCGVV
jgi:hypothetical protein